MYCCHLCFLLCLVLWKTSLHVFLSIYLGQCSTHLLRQVVGQVTDARSLVHRLVLQSHASLELILGREIPATCLEVNADDRGEADAVLVAAQLDVGSIFLARVEHLVERHVAYLDVSYISVIVTGGIHATYTSEGAEVLVELVSCTERQAEVILAAVHITVVAVLTAISESLV